MTEPISSSRRRIGLAALALRVSVSIMRSVPSAAQVATTPGIAPSRQARIASSDGLSAIQPAALRSVWPALGP